MKTLAGYLKDSKPGTDLTDFHGKALGWRVDATITNNRTPDGDRVYVLRLVKGRGKTQRIGGGLWLGDAGTLFRGQDFGIAPNPLDRIARRDIDNEIVEEAERWYQTNREDESREDEVNENPGRLTLTAAREAVRRYGFTLKKRDGEYILTPQMEREGERSYYTTDLQDAIDTARAQVERRWEETRARGQGGGYLR